MEIGIRPLPEAEKIISSIGLEMTYPFDDLVFVEHNPFFLRFDDDNAEHIIVHFNKDCVEDEKQKMLRIMQKEASSFGIKLSVELNYMMQQIEGTEEIEIQFMATV